jgi:putative peptide zinc metalloprotease protein
MADVNRPLPLRKRTDLIAERLCFGTRSSWVVKDPLSLRYFRFQDEEYAVLALLDGRRSLGEMRDEFERKFPPRRIKPEGLSRFAAQLHEQGLVVSDAPDQGERLLERRRKQSRGELLQKWTNPLAIRFRGIDPHRLLEAMYPWVRFLFSRAAVAVTVALMAMALLLVAVRWSEFVDKLPTLQQLFTPSTVVLLLTTLGAVKVLHEFGHGLCCRHFGGHCHELGAMFLVFTPCLYCNVTDSWRFPNKWHRIAVSAAGMYVELMLASLATFGWWLSAPGLFHNLCFAVMFVCSVNTLVFNGNPLLRYDGYYILADWVDVPNFGTKAQSVFYAILWRAVGRNRDFEDPLLPERNWFWFGCYHAAASIYRLVLTFSIALLFIELARPYHLENVVRAMATLVVASMILRPFKGIYRWWQRPGSRQGISSVRMSLTLIGVAGLIFAILAIPMPKRVWGTLEIEPRDAQRVYVTVPGRLIEQKAQPGDVVSPGDVLARLTNEDLEMQVDELQARLEQYRVRNESLERERFADPTAALRIPEVRKAFDATKKQLEEKQDEHRRLTLKADRSGTVLSAPIIPDREPPAGNLRTLSGRPHDRENLGCLLPSGSLYCEIGNPLHWNALVIVEQTDLPFVKLDSRVELKIDELPDVVFHGQVDEISQHQLEQAPKHLSNKSGGEIATETDALGGEVPLEKAYQVRVAFDDPEGLLRFGLRGTAKIRVERESLGSRLARWCAQTFYRRF